MKTVNSIILSSITVLNILSYNVDLIQGIRGGVDVPDGTFTYLAIILINNVYACGGSVVNSDTILSAGQCVLDEEGNFFDVTFEVIVGVTSFHPNDTDSKIKVDYIYVMSSFRTRGSSSRSRSFPRFLERGDLAILKLRYPIGNELNVNAALLPEKINYVFPKYALKTLNISGFGQNAAVGIQSSSDLSNIRSRLHLFGQQSYIKTLLLRENMCKDYYNDFSEDHICAKSEYPDIATGPCLGDAGDPLVWDNIIVGVMQYYTNNCDNRNWPAVYTRVSSFVTLIKMARDRCHTSEMRLGNYTGAHVIELSHTGRR